MEQRVLQFEYQQSLIQESERPGWSEKVCVSVRLLSEAISSGWYRLQFAKRGNDFVILLAIAMHARPLSGDDLKMLVNLHMATLADEGRLYARVSDAALAYELGMNRMTVARATHRLAQDKSIHMIEIPENLIAFRDSHGRFNGKKIYLIAGDIQGKFIEKNIAKLSPAQKSNTGSKPPAIKNCTPAPNSSINGVNDEEAEEEAGTFYLRVFSYFARKKGCLEFHPTIKEQIALQNLIKDGFCFDQIIAGIDIAFIRPSKPRYFTHCAAITRDLIRFQQETREPEALNQADHFHGGNSEVIETDLVRAVELYRSSGREITPDVLARFRLMAVRCERPARYCGSSGGEWLAGALTRGLGVAKPQNLLNYAEAVLNDWMTHGHEETHPLQAEKPGINLYKSSKSCPEPAAHAGIREYLKKCGGLQDGNEN